MHRRVSGLTQNLYKENCDQHFPTNTMHSYRQNSLFYAENPLGLLKENVNGVPKDSNKMAKDDSDKSISEASTNSTVSVAKKRHNSVIPRRKRTQTCIFSVLYN